MQILYKFLTLFFIIFISSPIFGQVINEEYLLAKNGYEEAILRPLNIYKNYPKKIITYNYVGNNKNKYSFEEMSYAFKDKLLVEQIIKLTYVGGSKVADVSTVSADKYTYEYNKEKLIKTTQYESNITDKKEYSLNRTEIISYNEENKIKQITIKFKKRNAVDKIIDIQYDNSLNPIKRILTSFNPFKNEMEISIITEYLYKNNRLVKVIKNFPRNNDKQEFLYDYPSNDKVVVRSKNIIATLSYIKGVIVKRVDEYLSKDVEYKYLEEIFKYDNQNRLKYVCSNNYDTLNETYKTFTMWDRCKELYYDDSNSKEIRSLKAKIIASDSLRMRKEPSIDAEKITSIPSNEIVDIIDKLNKQEIINGKTGTWVKIKWKEYEGWVFDAYLEKEK